MAKSHEVLGMLIPNGGYVQIGETYEGIKFIDCEPITKKQYTDGFAQYDAWKAEQETDKATAKATAQAKLAELGLTVEDLQALGL
jgi:Na+-transporting NADH:ubiquinone oxidoreductase subunit NqrF